MEEYCVYLWDDNAQLLRVCEYVYVYVCACMCICVYVYVCMHMYVCACMCVCVCVSKIVTSRMLSRNLCMALDLAV